MKKISEYQDGDALDLLADIMEPAAEIMVDDDVRKAFENDGKIKGVSIAIKKHKDAVMSIMARLDNVPIEDFHCNVLTLPARLLEILNDEQLLEFFTEQAQTMTSDGASGSATENTGDAER